ncbi:serine-rich adhesin for platelets [Linepithema humile]|uniref:serine-rich adhesin for platelets n=1 Tax=Linepithema humile TaxID=83485 RepID=UPI00351DF428
MSEGADSVAQTCEDLLEHSTDEGEHDGERNATATTAMQQQPPPLPPPPPPPPPPSSAMTYTGRRPRFGTGNVPPSPYVWVDGRQLRSALAWTKKRPLRRVSFPLNDNHLVTSYLEPANPWQHAENVNREDLISTYKESCARHGTEPLQNVLVQLENLNISQDRCEELNLKGETLDQDHSEPLEEILKRVQFNKIDLEGTSLNDESSIILFDMLEYYESARYLNISSNPEIGARGWQACSHMIKKTQCLEQLEARDITFNEQNMNILSRALRLVCHLHVLKLENCGLSGRAFIILVTALKMNSGIRELYLADNGLDLYDAIQLGSLLRMNNHLQLLDISNNNVQDDGVRDILEGLINQVNEDKTGKGLSILILWNNRLTKKSSPYFSRIIALSKTLETLNIGQNMLTDETLSIVNESLKKNRVLLQLGMQSTELTCEGIITLAEIMETNQVLQRIDLRDNSIQMRGMHALVNVMKKNKTITQIDLDDKPRIRIDGPVHQYIEMVAEIRSCCSKNEEYRQLEESVEDAESPQHPSRLLNASSRKISLTCQTLPSPASRSTKSLTANEPAACGMLEPKRTSGGRLRSPAPSPIPSPVASPIPSPSRNRFVVCRVSETLVRSAESSASSSPITPPSLGSSPCFFSNASGGSSRFRVSVVESTDTGRSPPKSVVASSNSGSVTIGFNVEIHAADSGDTDSAAKTDTAASDNVAASVDKFSVIPATRGTAVNEEARSAERKIQTQSAADETVLATCKNECGVAARVEKGRLDQSGAVRTLQSERNEDIAIKREGNCDESNDVTTDFESAATIERDAGVIRDHRTVYTSTKELQVPAYPNEATSSAKINVIEDCKVSNSAKRPLVDDILDYGAKQEATSEELSTCISESSASTVTETSSARLAEPHSQEPTSTSMQKHKSNLDKLLSLFQHPGQLFSDTSSAAAETKSTLQENINGVMALGDRLQQYLKESRAKLGTDNSWNFLEHDSPPKNKSMKLNVSQLQNLTGMFTSFKLEPYSSFVVEHGTKFFSQAKNQDANVREKDLDNLDKSTEIMVGRIGEKDLFSQEKNPVARSNDENLIGPKNDQVTRNSENQITKCDENDLNDKEKSETVNTNEVENLSDRVSRNDKELISHENNQILNKQSNLFDEMKSEIVEIEARDLHEEERRVAENANVRFEMRKAENQVVEDGENLEDRRKDKIASDDERDWEKISTGNSEDLESRIARNDERDSVDDACVDDEGSACSVDKLQWTKFDFSDQLLSESVQSKDNLVDNLVLDDCLATDAAILPPVLPSPSKSIACTTVKLTNIAEYSTLELNKIDSTGCNSKQDSKHIERDNECLKRDEILGNDSVKCLERDDAVGEANASTARKTCDKITTDSINQTSNNSFAICNIAHDRKAVDNVSTASTSTGATTDDNVDAIESASDNDRTSASLSMSVDDAETLSTSLENVDACDHLNKKVTTSTRCIADEDHQRDFTQREPEENLTEVLDDVCCDFAHCRSTNVNIKVEQRESETVSRPGGGQTSEEHRERVQFMPNNINNVYRNILKDEADIKDSPAGTVEQSKRTDPTIASHLTPYKTSANSAKSSDAEELIFCMTDISTDGASAEDELSPSVASKNSSNRVAGIAESYFELPASRTAATSATTALIGENPESVHGDSQDFGIDDAGIGTADAQPMPPPPPPPPPRGSLQESVDSGIESECSSICIRVDSTAEWKVELVTVPSKSSRNDNGVYERTDGEMKRENEGEDNGKFEEFASDFLARNTRLADNDSVSNNIAHSYLNSIKCPVVGGARSVTATTSDAPLGIEVTADEICPAAPIIAHSPAAVHSTSPK